MRDGGAGPFAVVALILVLGVQVVALAQVAVTASWPVVVLACAAGRGAFVFCCRKGIPAARPEGMGALVAGSQQIPIVAAWWVLLLAAAVVTAGWTGVIGVVLAAAALLGFTAHVRRRFGGITGDVLGAGCELSTTLVLAACSFS